MSGSSPGPGIWVLLTLRFLLEMCLLAAWVVGAGRLLGGPGGWAVAVLAGVVIATVWGVLLAPRRRVQLPVGARVAIELALFAGGALLLAASGLVAAGLALAAAELVVLGLLRGPDRHAL